MLINSSIAHKAIWLSSRCPMARFSLTISDKPRFIVFRPPSQIDMRTEVIERNVERHRINQESRARFAAGPRRPYVPGWWAELGRPALAPAE